MDFKTNEYHLKGCKGIRLGILQKVAIDYDLNFGIDYGKDIWYGNILTKEGNGFFHMSYEQSKPTELLISVFEEIDLSNLKLTQIITELIKKFNPNSLDKLIEDPNSSENEKKKKISYAIL
ncbi:hypothetical protein KY321_01950 [Candidatus Woesearchaeota archaeon]|nr:hypothetical protein [Candidatus Woesearchaeota archaeon]